MTYSKKPYDNKQDTHIPDLTSEEEVTLQNIRSTIMQADPMVDERIGDYMQHKKVLLYEQEGEFKYCLFRTKNYFTFRSAVMYKHPEVRQMIYKSSYFRVQKGCINFPSLKDFPLAEFGKWISHSASMPFMHAAVSRYYG